MNGRRSVRSGVAWSAATALVMLGVVASPAQADGAVIGSSSTASVALPATVSADALPTAQINGVVWKQEVVGTTVYVAGNFTSARPAGAALGTSEVPRANMLAYDLTTGVLLPSFAPTFNAEVIDLSVSPDRSTLYAAGSFTVVDGQSRYRVAAFDLATGTLLESFQPVVNATVSAIQATNDAVYLGGIFSVVGGETRSRVAAVSPTDASLLPFAATITDGSVQSMVAAPDGASVVVGGSFTSVNGSATPGYGLVRLAAGTGAVLPLPVNTTDVRAAGANAAVLSLESDGDHFYGTGYAFGGGGNLEGTFSADWATGTLTWVEDCHGDTYSAFPLNGVVYEASHKHYCANSGGFPQTTPWTFHRATAVSTSVGAVNTPDIYGYKDHAGRPSPSLLPWFPDINAGTFTGKAQGPWTVSGSGDYVLYGGEFTKVNGQAQQGLVRFVSRSLAPNLQGPRLTSASFSLRATSTSTGTVDVSWTGNWDRDDTTLTYRLYRASTTVPPIVERTATASFWNLPVMGFTDTGRTPGATERYRVTATDPAGNVARSDWFSVQVAATGARSAYLSAVRADEPLSFWRLDDASGATLADSTGVNPMTAAGGVSLGAAGATGDGGTAAALTGTSTGTAYATIATNAPRDVTVEAWVRTTTARGGQIVGFGAAKTGRSSISDRQLYMDASGRVSFGIQSSTVQTVTSPRSYNDGAAHHLAGTYAAGVLRLFVDGVQVAERTDVPWDRLFWGQWRIGGDRLVGWPNQPASEYFAGTVDDVAVYSRALSPEQVAAHVTASGRTTTAPPVPADPYGAAVRGAAPDLYWRLGESAGATAADAGVTGTGTGGYRAGTTLGLPGALAATSDTAARFNGSAGLVSSDRLYVNPTTFSEELWFQTTSTSGGVLIGFGNRQTGLSTTRDRQVRLEVNGRVTFATGSASISSTAAYNDGGWHHLVASQASEGMRLYLDGALVGQNASTASAAYSGYWRVGGDATGGATSYVDAVIDEVAVYSHALSAAQVLTHRNLGSGQNAAPTAQFSASATGLAVTVDGSASSDLDGSVTGHAWSFGDGGSASGATAVHTYAAAGTYPVTLTVTDDRGAVGSLVTSVTVTAPNLAPTASFSSVVSDLGVVLDGSTSSDPDGTVAAWSWQFGDGASAAGQTAAHTYAAAGAYAVTLTVTDSAGATGSVTQQVVVTSPNPGGDLAADGFARSVAGGWGFADTGGPWTSTGTASRFSVDGAAGLHADVAGGTLTSALDQVSSTSTQVRVTISADKVPTGSGAYLSVIGRRVTPTDGYGARVRLRSDGAVELHLVRANGSPVKGGVVSGLTFAAGDRLQVRLQVDGTAPTTVQAKVWTLGQPEPAEWTVSTTDSTASLQAPGSVALVTYLFGSVTNGPVVASYDDLWVGAVGAAQNTPPTAAFASTVAGLMASVDGSTSSDAEGPIAGYAWDFGDGGSATGSTASHTYAAAGTYQVTLKVTDGGGVSAQVTNPVTVVAPPVPDLAADTFGRAVSGGWGTAQTGGDWTAAGTASRFSVDGQAGVHTLTAGATAVSSLDTVSSSSTSVVLTVAPDTVPNGGGAYVQVQARRVTAVDAYAARVRLQADGTVQLNLTRGNGTPFKGGTVAGLTYAAGDRLTIRVEVTGVAPTTVRAKVWKTAEVEPAAWTVEATDVTATLQVPGSFGISTYLFSSATNGPIAFRYDDLLVRPIG